MEDRTVEEDALELARVMVELRRLRPDAWHRVMREIDAILAGPEEKQAKVI